MDGTGQSSFFEKSRFSTDEIINLPLLCKVDIDGTRFWQFGNNPDPSKGHLISNPSTVRGRVSAVFDDDTEEYCYFIMVPTGRQDAEWPNVLGLYMFNHKEEWEGVEARRPEELFR